MARAGPTAPRSDGPGAPGPKLFQPRTAVASRTRVGKSQARPVTSESQ